MNAQEFKFRSINGTRNTILEIIYIIYACHGMINVIKYIIQRRSF